MNDNSDLEVKYLGLSFRYSTYVRMQIAIVVACLIGAGLFFLFARTSEVWYLRHGWLICLLMVAGEVVESGVAIKKAKRDRDAALSKANVPLDEEAN